MKVIVIKILIFLFPKLQELISCSFLPIPHTYTPTHEHVKSKSLAEKAGQLR